MKHLNMKVAFAAILGIGIITVPAGAVERTVDCDEGQSLQAALETAKGNADGLEIVVRGTCEESVTISRDRVSIVGEGDASIVGQIRIFGPGNIFLQDLTITGSGNGVVAYGGRTRFNRVNVIANEGIGIYVEDGGAIRVNNSQIESNGGFGVLIRGSYGRFLNSHVFNNADTGVSATDNSNLNYLGGSVTYNSGSGIDVSVSSALSIENQTQVSNNGVNGVGIDFSSAAVLGNVDLKDNDKNGLSVLGNSSAGIFDTTIAGNLEHGIYLSGHSMARMWGSGEVWDNDLVAIAIFRDSGVEVASPHWQIDASPPYSAVWCDGDESSIDVHPDATMIGPIGCLHPEF